MLGDILGLSFPDLTVTITSNGVDYTRVYDWQDYD